VPAVSVNGETGSRTSALSSPGAGLKGLSETTISALASAAVAVAGSRQSIVGSTFRSTQALSGASAPTMRLASRPPAWGRAPTSWAPTVLAPSTSQPKLAPV
jgi:hypothetical protein